MYYYRLDFGLFYSMEQSLKMWTVASVAAEPDIDILFKSSSKVAVVLSMNTNILGS